MKYIFFSTLLFTLSFGDVFSMNSFEADFIQKVTNEKGNTLKYTGHIKAMKPQYALWEYYKPSTKFIYVNKNKVMILEPDLEQVIVKELHSSIDFFKIIKNAIKIDKNTYTTSIQSIKYTIHTSDTHLKSIEYKDQLDNSVSIDFTNNVINKQMDTKGFTLSIPLGYDVIQG